MVPSNVTCQKWPFPSRGFCQLRAGEHFEELGWEVGVTIFLERLAECLCLCCSRPEGSVWHSHALHRTYSLDFELVLCTQLLRLYSSLYLEIAENFLKKIWKPVLHLLLIKSSKGTSCCQFLCSKGRRVEQEFYHWTPISVSCCGLWSWILVLVIL